MLTSIILELFQFLHYLINIDLLKEEGIAMCKYEKPNGGIRWDISDEKKWTTSGFDDRAYCFAMAGHYLWELRHNDTLHKNDNNINFSSAPSCISVIDFWFIVTMKL